MAETAGLWLRVSTEGQDEETQRPDLARWCEAHGYDVTATYEVRGKSAYHGKHAAALDRAFGDMEAGKITVLVVWAADRIERRGALAALTLAERARKAGGRLEYVKDVHLNAVNEMSDVMLALSATLARQESKRKSERSIADQTARRDRGSVVGRPPWGYAIRCTVCGEVTPACAKSRHIKVLAPTPEGRKYAPQIFQSVIKGKSLRSVAAWLDSEGVSTVQGEHWNEAFIGNRLIKNPTYYGQRPNSGQLETPALVSATTWQEANAALSGRVRPGRRTAVREKPLVMPFCGQCYRQVREGCPSGRSPMYRIHAKYGAAGEGDYFRCTGHGPQRKGCGAPMIPVAQVEADVTDMMLADHRDHYDRVFVPGDDRSDEIARLRERGATAMRSGDYASATEAIQEAARLEALPRVAPRWDEQPTGQSEAEWFDSLDKAGQREYMSTMVVTADLDGVVIVPRWAVASGE